MDQVAKAYDVRLTTTYTTYPTSDESVRAVSAGKADASDPFNRQWTLISVNGSQVGRIAVVDPEDRASCATLATPTLA